MTDRQLTAPIAEDETASAAPASGRASPKGGTASMLRTAESRPPLVPGTHAHAAALRAWNLSIRHDPAAAFAAASTDDVITAVRYASLRGLGVAPTGTGHGIGAVGADGVLLNTAAMRQVDVDPVRRTATVGAGARWVDVHAAARRHGLVGVAGSSGQVGVVGYTQGGGFGWLSRQLGFASSSVRSAELVTADGELLMLDEHHDPELLWGVAGGAGNLGVVTRLTFDLHRVGVPGAAGPATVFGGTIYYPIERAVEVATFYASATELLPREVMSALTFRWFPPAPTVPEPLRNRAFVALRACASGSSRAGEELVQLTRTTLGTPVVDTFTALPAHDLDAISADPTTPVHAMQHGETLRELDAAAIAVLAEEAQRVLGPPLVTLELRRLGGAMDVAPRGPHPMARTRGRYSVNTVGLVPTPDAEEPAKARQRQIFDGLRPHLTGDTYLNFLGGDAAPERVRAAYDDADWARLVDLKSAVDPDNTFRFGRTVSADPR